MKIYLVGGAVRDRLLGIKNYDRDYVVTGSSEEELLSLGYKRVGRSFPVFLHPETGHEHALARKERKSGVGYTGFICDFSPDVTLEEDLERRDLTVNAIAEDEHGNLIDPSGGIQDIEKRILRHIGPAFSEDPLRVLRVARFSAKLSPLGFTVAPETIELMRQMAQSGELESLTAERIFKEFDRAMGCEGADFFIKTLRDCGALRVLFPEINALYGIPARRYWHPEVDTGRHMELCLSYGARHGYSRLEMFCIFCHDFGKALTDPSMLPSHQGHGLRGIPIIEAFCDRLKVPSEYRYAAKMVASHHSFVHLALRKSTEDILGLFLAIDAFRRPDNLNILLRCCTADIRGRQGFEDLQYIHPELAEALFAPAAAVGVKEILAKGFSGSAIGTEQNRIRLEAMNARRIEWEKENSQRILSERQDFRK